MIRVYSEVEQGNTWLAQHRGLPPVFACVLGFTETGLIPGISAAGATPQDRQYTAIADAEFLYNGPQPHPRYPLPPLQAGASPVLISRAVVAAQAIPVHLFNAGLPVPPTVPCVDLGGLPARCLTQANALDLTIAKHLFQQGLIWGERLAAEATPGYLVLAECVVGGTTTALSVLTGLGWNALGKVNSSHPTCNHQQKWEVVNAGLRQFAAQNPCLVQKPKIPPQSQSQLLSQSQATTTPDPLALIAAVGDPMQITVAGMAIAASRNCGVLLAGGTQMLAVYALTKAIANTYGLSWQAERVVVGTTRWVAEDPTGDTVGLAKMIQAPLIATQLSFTTSQYRQLRAYEQGYVKEGVGAGGCAIASHLYQEWGQSQLLQAVEALAESYQQICSVNISESC
ncbi:MAG: TIGR00303 family protein [Elainellaceae cyanobacterium]